ncbi:molybdate ABC transporter substrate-binding protein [Marinihelvus fidelis]|uniref:Molybdate ABC transporter substrate-binding protein n=1 Tax=Marinihelvus fidelis TaxID=2613842 RepID=A0A5N0TBZ4_9GAMM|nr:molybdate ABC transporter substrate-binding protein [Marinihelvus fidelis]KAA9131934.1 molybdate ABC transporter substrate-binding protein [Marinihelvus fidelis]
MKTEPASPITALSDYTHLEKARPARAFSWGRLAAPALLTLLLGLAMAQGLSADTLRIAVASNFSPTLDQLVEAYPGRSMHRVTLSAASTGKHYAQIINGAPYDLFLAADRARPETLERDGQAVAGTRRTYAIGRLVLWAPSLPQNEVGPELLDPGYPGRLAIANPKLAPYGLAARQVLEHRDAWAAFEPHLVMGENIGQAWLFVASGNADMGLVAASQWQLAKRRSMAGGPGSAWSVPAEWHEPIVQQMVLLRDTPAARDFYAFLASEDARRIITDAGYDTVAGHD